MRGKVACADQTIQPDGITPAWAGKRFWNRPWVWATSDHPRVGGEKRFRGGSLQSQEGSPPHRRGKVHHHVIKDGQHRITPAQAGKICSDRRCSNRRWDHPRVGGEKPRTARRTLRARGSPPRWRGKEVADEGIGGIIRITPAWAGKRRSQGAAALQSGDHPRVGGEKDWGISVMDYRAGSPPRGRGKGSPHPCPLILAGITPAHAGKSNILGQSPWKSEDHPRVGGEKLDLGAN